MNRFLFVLVILITNSFTVIGQEKMSYFFDKVVTNNVKDYQTNFKGQIISFQNQKDSTYILQIRNNSGKKEAEITDYKNSLRITFEINFDYNSIEDLNKLSKSKLYKRVQFGKGKRFKDFNEEFEFENDTTTNKKIVHLTQFKNKTNKKITNEHYYFFGKNKNIATIDKKSLKNYLTEKYKIVFESDENLEKILHLSDGKILNETEIIQIENVNFNFNFTIDEIFPKHN